MSTSFESILKLLRAAGEPTRLRIIALLTYDEMVAQEITSILAQSQPRVSNHLKHLFEAEIIERRAEGSWVFYRLGEKPEIRRIVSLIMEVLGDGSPVFLKDKEKYLEIREKREEQAKHYFEKIAPDWDRLRALHQPEKRVESALKALLGTRKFKMHLDLGAGLGSILETLKDFSETSEGIDRSHKMLAMARVRLEHLKDKTRVIHGDILNLPYRDNFADIVTIYQVLHYLDNPKAALKEAMRVIKPDGVLLIAEFAPHSNEDLRSEFGHKRLGFKQSELIDWCVDLGLRLEGQEFVTGRDDSKSANSLDVNILKFSKPDNTIIFDAPIVKKDFA